MTGTDVEVFPTPAELASTVAARLVRRLIELQSAGRVPSIVLTGGSIAEQVHRAVLRTPGHEAVDWSRVEVWFGDERFVPAADDDRNALQARRALLDDLPLDAARLHEMPASDGVLGDDADAAAAAYADEIRRVLGEEPRLDVLMLGVGPDGHCASLFPGHDAVRAPGLAVAVHDSPKPPPTRISLTLPLLRRADEVWFVAAGAEKAEAVGAAVTGADPLVVPAAGPRGTERTLWFLDSAAASRLEGRPRG